ncbi:MAG: transposase [Pirellulales bacterium]
MSRVVRIPSREGTPPMVIVEETADPLKRFLKLSDLNYFAQLMLMRMVLCFIAHRGKMSCMQAAGMIASDSVHRSQLTRFLARGRWKSRDFNEPLRTALLKRESLKGVFILIVDATLTSQQGKQTENTFSVQNRKQRSSKKKRYAKRKYPSKKCHSFTFGLLITPSGIRIAYQIPFKTVEYCQKYGIDRLTTAQAAAEMIKSLPLPTQAQVVVLGDTAYEADVVRQACEQRGYTWIFPANSSRVFAGPQGKRPSLRSRLKSWSKLSLKKIRLQASSGKFVNQRRLSAHRLGPKVKARVYYAYEETRDVKGVGLARIVYSTTKAQLKEATADDVKILITNAKGISLQEVLELYSLRWQIELFFKELKSTLGFDHYSFKRFEAVVGWAESVITTFLYLEYERARRLADRSTTADERKWWSTQRCHGLGQAVQTALKKRELKYLRDRLKTPGGIAKLQRLLLKAQPGEYRMSA